MEHARIESTGQDEAAPGKLTEVRHAETTDSSVAWTQALHRCVALHIPLPAARIVQHAQHHRRRMRSIGTRDVCPAHGPKYSAWVMGGALLHSVHTQAMGATASKSGQ